MGPRAPCNDQLLTYPLPDVMTQPPTETISQTITQMQISLRSESGSPF